MSIYGDYAHSVLHHQTESEIMRDAEQRRLLREARGERAGFHWRGLFGSSRDAGRRWFRSARGRRIGNATQPVVR